MTRVFIKMTRVFTEMVRVFTGMTRVVTGYLDELTEKNGCYYRQYCSTACQYALLIP